jgi:glycosyltransferase involved in cell wall biosynthesis
MVRVCHIISGDLWGGAEVMVYHLLKGLRVYDEVKVSAILLNEGRLARELRELGVTVHIVNEGKISFFTIVRAIRGKIRKLHPDVIHSHGYKANILAGLVARTLRGIRLVGTQHGFPRAYVRRANLRRYLVHKCNSFILSRYFHRIVGVSQDIRTAFVKHHGFRDDKIAVIHNGIEFPNVVPKRDNGETFVIGSSGRLFPVKDYSFMVEIAREIRKQCKRFFFELAGDGPERDKVLLLIRGYDLNGAFRLRGHIDDMSAFYRGLDLYLNTSIHEGIPMSVLEAMAHWLPVVAPNVGGMREILDDGVQGFLLEDRNPEVFAEKCILLYENKTLRQRMSEAARKKVVQSFSIEQMAHQYYNLYLSFS